MAKKEEVVKSSPTTLTVPAHLLKFQGRSEGKEQIEREDIILPRIAIAQGTSTQLKKNDTSYIPDLEEGDIFNNLTGQIYGSSVELIPLLMFKTGFNALPMSQGGGIVCISPNAKDCPKYGIGNCKCRDWTENEQTGHNDPPECALVRNFIVVLPDSQEIALLSIMKTSSPAAKRLISLASQRGDFPLFAGKYALSTAVQTDGKLSWHVFKVDNAGWTPEPLADFVEKKYNEYKVWVSEGKISGYQEAEPDPLEDIVNVTNDGENPPKF